MISTTSLPWLGLGLSANLDARAVPNPWALQARHPDLFDFVEYSAPLSLAQARAQAPLMRVLEENLSALPAVFHPVHLNLHGPELAPKPVLAALDAHLREVGSPWVGNDVGWWHHQDGAFPGYLYLPPPLDGAGLTDAVLHAQHVQSHLHVPLLLENPAIIARRGPMHVLDFMAALHARTGCGLILDLGHLLAFQLTAGLDPTSGLDGFPLDSVLELHLAGGAVAARGERKFYFDDHTQPVQEALFDLLDAVLPRCTNLRAVCFEGDGHPPERAAATLRRLRKAVPFARDPIDWPAPPPHEKAKLSGEARHWQAFEALYGERNLDGDPQGHRAETDYRLAVLAESLDRTLPLTRLLAAGTRAQLLAFGRSPELRNFFDGTGRELGQCFASFVRRQLRERPDPGREAVLAFELWALAQLTREDPRLARGVCVASFPSNLGEVLFAAAAMRKHVLGRAWGSGLWEPGALELLAQAAARAEPGPWTVALRRTEHGVAVVDLDPALLEVLRLAQAGTPILKLAQDPRFAEGVGRAERLGLLNPA